MKIRNGYVSNSSSSSFCILGKKFDKNNFMLNGQEIDLYFDDLISCESFFDTYKEQQGMKTSKLEMVGMMDDYRYNVFVGMMPDSMQNNETLDQFKERIVIEAKKLGIEISKDELKWYKDQGRI